MLRGEPSANLALKTTSGMPEGPRMARGSSGPKAAAAWLDMTVSSELSLPGAAEKFCVRCACQTDVPKYFLPGTAVTREK